MKILEREVKSMLDTKLVKLNRKIHGEIIDTPQGSNGFGYNPIFYIPSLDKTVAQLDDEVKNEISHRRLATNNLINKLKIA